MVRQGPEGDVGAASRVALQEDELLVCDVLRQHGQTQIIAANIDTTRRQAFIFTRRSTFSGPQGTTVVIKKYTHFSLGPLYSQIV